MPQCLRMGKLGQVWSFLVGGFNCIFLSGKTYTMEGRPGKEGLIPRIVHNLFERIREQEKLPNKKFQVLCMFLALKLLC